MQDIQNIPNPDVESTHNEGDFGTHHDYPDTGDADRGSTDVESPTTPPDRPQSPPIEEPPSTDAPIEEDDDEPRQIV